MNAISGLWRLEALIDAEPHGERIESNPLGIGFLFAYFPVK